MARSPSQLKGVIAVARPPLLANSVAHRFDSVLVGAHGNVSALELRYPFLTFAAAGCGYLLPSQAVCLFLSLLPLTWIDYSMNSAIILAQSCIRDPRPLRWFQLQYFLEVGNGNMASALFNPLQQLLAIGSSDRQTGGPVSQPPHPVLHVSRFGVIPKRHHPGKWRLILDLSSPAGHSANDGIAGEHFSLHYMDVDEITAGMRLGRGSLMAKLDVQMHTSLGMVAASSSTPSGLCWPTSRFLQMPLGFLVTEQLYRVTGFQAPRSQNRSLSPLSTSTVKHLFPMVVAAYLRGPPMGLKRVNVREFCGLVLQEPPAIMS